MPACIHCGTPRPPENKAFCSQSCRTMYIEYFGFPHAEVSEEDIYDWGDHDPEDVKWGDPYEIKGHGGPIRGPRVTPDTIPAENLSASEADSIPEPAKSPGQTDTYEDTDDLQILLSQVKPLSHEVNETIRACLKGSKTIAEWADTYAQATAAAAALCGTVQQLEHYPIAAPAVRAGMDSLAHVYQRLSACFAVYALELSKRYPNEDSE